MKVRDGKFEIGHFEREKSDSDWDISDISECLCDTKKPLPMRMLQTPSLLSYFNLELTLELYSHMDLGISSLGCTILFHKGSVSFSLGSSKTTFALLNSSYMMTQDSPDETKGAKGKQKMERKQ